MKKLLLLIAACFLLSVTFPSTVILTNELNANKIFLSVGKTGKQISLMELSTISRSDMETMTGRKMKFFERLSFSSAQRKLKRGISADGTIHNKKLQKLFLNRGGETGFNLGGFLLGFFLLPIGVLIAYLIKDDYKRSRVKWAWLGLLTYVIVVILGAFLVFLIGG